MAMPSPRLRIEDSMAGERDWQVAKQGILGVFCAAGAGSPLPAQSRQVMRKNRISRRA